MILEGINLFKEYPSRYSNDIIQALNNVTVSIEKGKTLGLVGESGSGKSTLGEILGDLQEPTKGTVKYKGKDINKLSRKEYLNYRKNIQFIFQNPQGSMNPNFRIIEVLSEPMESLLKDFDKKEASEKIKIMIKEVGLDQSYLTKYPRELSGGQCQRVAIARALLLNPEVIICDECVSALDVSVQAQILNLLKQLQQRFETSFLFISHDIATVKYMSDNILVLYRGNLVEYGDSDKVLNNPQNDYTKKLLYYVNLKNS